MLSSLFPVKSKALNVVLNSLRIQYQTVVNLFYLFLPVRNKEQQKTTRHFKMKCLAQILYFSAVFLKK